MSSLFMGLLGLRCPMEDPGSCPPRSLSVPHPKTPTISWGPLWNLTCGQLPARPFCGPEARLSPAPHPIAACTSAFLECVCISDICISEAFKNSIFVMKANEEELVLKRTK